LAADWFVERGLFAFQQMASISILPVYILDKPTTGGVNTVVVSAKHTPVNDNDMTTVLKMLLSIIIRFSESLRTSCRHVLFHYHFNNEVLSWIDVG
jgi:hypothetical protein